MANWINFAIAICGLVTAALSLAIQHQKLKQMAKVGEQLEAKLRAELRNGTTDRINSLEAALRQGMAHMERADINRQYAFDEFRQSVHNQLVDLQMHVDRMTKPRSNNPERP